MGEICGGREAVRIFRAAHVPTFETPEDAVRAYMYMYDYTRNLGNLYETPSDILPDFTPDREREAHASSRGAGRPASILSEPEAKQVLEAYQIPSTRMKVCSSAEECAKAAEGFGFPVAIKILSHDITHKSDVGGIALNVRSAPEAANQFTKITERVKLAAPKAKIIGVSVQAMSRGGYEVIIGSKKDPTFGPALMFGMGGTGVELYRDVAVDFPPLNQALARSMIQSTKVSKLLEGYRGKEAIDMTALEQAMVKVSYLLVDFPEILEMDINPLQVRADGLCALDARIVIEPKDVRKIILPGSHLMILMYPSKDEWSINFNGDKALIRPIRPEDEALWAEMIESLSPATAEYRFFGPVKEVTKSMRCATATSTTTARSPWQPSPPPRASAERRWSASAASPSRRPTLKRVSSPSWCATTTSARASAASSSSRSSRWPAATRPRDLSGHVLAANPGMTRFAENLGFDVRPGEEPEVRRLVLRL